MEAVARRSYGRLIAALVRRWGDLAAAEDSLSEAFTEALRDWERRGLPRDPEGWLLAVAQRRQIDLIRRSSNGRRLEASVEWPEPEGWQPELPDERLELMMLCAHPSLDPQIRVPLMLQAVLGVSAHWLAQGFAVSPASMSSRLVRAKKRIKHNALRFELPPESERVGRLQSVLDGLYLAFTLEGDSLGDNQRAPGLRAEVAALLDILVTLWRSHAELLGLAALVAYQLARQESRLDGAGQWVPFWEQEVSRWNRALLAKAEELLIEAHGLEAPGRYQIEAAIESAHIGARLSGRSNWPQVLGLFEWLVKLAPCLSTEIARASALLQSGDHQAAWQALQAIDPSSVEHYQPYWAALWAVSSKRGDGELACFAQGRAEELAQGESQRRYLDRLASSRRDSGRARRR